MISNFTFPTIIGTKIPDYSEGSLLQMRGVPWIDLDEVRYTGEI
jgi:hypothetical protein